MYSFEVSERAVIYLLCSLMMAITFHIVVYFAYGTETFWQEPWVNHVFWGIISSGVLLLLLSELRCSLCRELWDRWRLLCTGDYYWQSQDILQDRK